MFKKPLKVEGMQRAIDSSDYPYEKNTPFVTIGEDGSPNNTILVDLESKDIQGFWLMHERKLWLLITICSLIFAVYLFGG